VVNAFCGFNKLMSFNKNILNKPELKEYRRFLRKKSTSALWNILKNKNIEGRKFRRQYSIGNYITDFCCPQEKIIIELDGDFHAEYYQIENDILREEFITKQGFNVIRFENKLVFEDPEYVIETIKKHFKG
jgi:very-short-patch-repair endonuclease